MIGSAFRLRTTFGQAMPALEAAAAQVWQLPGLRERYPEYLRAMHGVIRASVPLMELAARRCAERPDDPVAAPLRTYLLRHVIEERGHDDWLLDDLAALGHAVGPLASAPPPPAVARLVGAQYYWVLHHHPVALLGYIAVMEGNAPHVGLVARLVESAGLPETALRTVRDHAALDTAHTRAVYDLIDSLPLTPDQTTAIAVSGLCTAEGLMRLFAHIARTRKDGAR
ncbi:iron-containing redox enzyme family protein [Plantactinospora sp. WMMB334]|uniref:iron-containing redox enzyme family protein n=1 Tax=Plantactinospora sp. WMMB334 TaxID=3404119 RepID=UPI003B927616